MLKVLIVDDERKIIQLIEHLVDWGELSMEVVGKAENGIEALDLAKRFLPDIIITDIRMPGLDGLELISAVKEVLPNTEIIIISGYRHFEYAQTALKFGVSDYLLKPIKRDELNKTLEKIAKKSGHRKTDEWQKIRDSSSLRQIFIRDIIHGYRIENARDYHIRFDCEVWSVVIVKFDGDVLGVKSNADFILEKGQHDFKEILSDMVGEMEMYVEDSRIFAILGYALAEKESIYKGLRRFLEWMTPREHILEGLRTTIAFGTGVFSVLELGKSLHNAKLWIEERIVQGTNTVYVGEWDAENAFPESTLFTKYQREIEKVLESLDVDEVSEVLVSLKRSMLEEERISGHNVLQMCKQVFNQVLLFAGKNRVYLREDAMEEFNQKLDRCGAVLDVLSCMIREVAQVYMSLAERKIAEDHRPIRMAKMYIQENFNKSITLEEVSEVVGFAPTYLSNLFKKETGSTFLEYVQFKRMEVAKHLLRTTNLSVAVIGEKVGYGDVRYFTRTFMKNSGLKPNEYRKLYA